MKPTTKNILIGLSIAISVILILLMISFIVIYVILVMERNADHNKLGHCVPLIDETIEMERSLNNTKRFLSSPENYKNLADKCEEAINCVKTVGSSVASDVLHTFPACQFYIFYNRDFKDCANKLILKKNGGEKCLGVLFNDDQDSKIYKCKQWDDIQECIKTEIDLSCGGIMAKQFEKEAANLRSSICSEDIIKND